MGFVNFITGKVQYAILFLFAAVSAVWSAVLVEGIPFSVKSAEGFGRVLETSFTWFLEHPKEYVMALILCCVSFVLLILLGIATSCLPFKIQASYHESLPIWLKIISVLLGGALIVLGFYFMSYFLLLFLMFSVVAIGVVLWGIGKK